MIISLILLCIKSFHFYTTVEAHYCGGGFISLMRSTLSFRGWVYMGWPFNVLEVCNEKFHSLLPEPLLSYTQVTIKWFIEACSRLIYFNFLNSRVNHNIATFLCALIIAVFVLDLFPVQYNVLIHIVCGFHCVWSRFEIRLGLGPILGW